MRVEEVIDQETLKAYLETLPEQEQREVSMRAAFRAVARVLPIAADAFLRDVSVQNQELTPVVIFGAVAFSGIVMKTTNNEIAAAMPAAKASHAAASAAAEAAGEATAVSATARAAAYAAAPAVYLTSRANVAGDAVPIAARAAELAKDLNVDFWRLVRRDLLGSGKLWPDGVPPIMQSHWEAAVAAMEGHPADWSIWIHWYNRVLQDRDWYPERMHEVLKEIADGAWEKGPAHINPMFEEVLELYLADRRAISGSPNDARPTRHMRSIRAQVITLQDYLETEWRNLSGHNSRTEEQDEILELLNDLKALVEDMILRLGDAESDGRALVVVDENLPAIVEKTGALALVEAQPAVSETVALMSATIKSLVDAGADPKLATQIAMSEAAGSKLFTKIRRFFGK